MLHALRCTWYFVGVRSLQSGRILRVSYMVFVFVADGAVRPLKPFQHGTPDIGTKYLELARLEGVEKR